MAKRDFYSVLGVPKTATADEIKRAYRKLAKQFHPDRNKGDASAEKKFKEVQAAYDVLGDEKKRRDYDEYGEAGVGSFQTGPHGQRVYTWGGGDRRVNVEDLEDLFSAFGGGGGGGGASVFEQVFGRGGRAGRSRGRQPVSQRGQDVEHGVAIGFEQAVRGTSIELDISGAAGNGRGRQTLSVKIPPGVQDGQRIRLRGKGQPGHAGGEPGDLFLVVHLQPHAVFRREGRDIVVDAPISVFDAVLGGKIDVPTLEGVVTVTVPPGAAGGSRLRIRGKGVAASGDTPAGDQYVVLKIVTPKNLTAEQRREFERLAEAFEGHPREPRATATEEARS